MKKHNFNAGPSILPREVIEDTAKAILDFNGSGLSLMEISHRAKDFQPVVDEAEALFKELLNIPEGYSVLFLGGGASMEFCMVPYNFLEKKAAYLNTGVWAKKAMKEAKGFGEVVEVASSAEATYTYIPKDYTIPTDADYFHITTNNTIYGTELKKDLDSPVPMVADMSSDIFSICQNNHAVFFGSGAFFSSNNNFHTVTNLRLTGQHVLIVWFCHRHLALAAGAFSPARCFYPCNAVTAAVFKDSGFVGCFAICVKIYSNSLLHIVYLI